MTKTKFTPLEIEIITDRPEDCICEHLCQDQNGKVNKTNQVWIEQLEGYNKKLYDNKVYPEQMTDDAISDIYCQLKKDGTLPQPLSDLHKEILDNCISCGTWDRADEVSPQFWGATKRAVKSIAEKFHNLNIEISYLDLNWCLIS